MELERFLSRLASVILGIVLFPVVMVIAAIGWLKVAGDNNFGIVLGAVVALSTSVLIIWKGACIFRKLLETLRSRLPEPIYSCLAFGTSGALSTGGIMLVVILLLGHTRPMGWELDRIPTWMAIVFAICVVCILPSGIQRRRARKSRSA